MRELKYDKSEIMRNAHRHHLSTFGGSWSESLKWAWARAKEEVMNAETSARRHAEYRKRYGDYDRRLARESANVIWGKNDWAWIYKKHRRA